MRSITNGGAAPTRFACLVGTLTFFVSNRDKYSGRLDTVKLTENLQRFRTAIIRKRSGLYAHFDRDPVLPSLGTIQFTKPHRHETAAGPQTLETCCRKPAYAGASFFRDTQQRRTAGLSSDVTSQTRPSESRSVRTPACQLRAFAQNEIRSPAAQGIGGAGTPFATKAETNRNSRYPDLRPPDRRPRRRGYQGSK